MRVQVSVLRPSRRWLPSVEPDETATVSLVAEVYTFRRKVVNVWIVDAKHTVAVQAGEVLDFWQAVKYALVVALNLPPNTKVVVMSDLLRELQTQVEKV